ncbi:hypothetical protein KI387_032545, partial [Taxus chinensis]
SGILQTYTIWSKNSEPKYISKLDLRSPILRVSPLIKLLNVESPLVFRCFHNDFDIDASPITAFGIAVDCNPPQIHSNCSTLGLSTSSILSSVQLFTTRLYTLMITTLQSKYPLRLEGKPKRTKATLTKNGADDGEHMVRGSSTLNAEWELNAKYVLPNPVWSEGLPSDGVLQNTNLLP